MNMKLIVISLYKYKFGIFYKFFSIRNFTGVKVVKLLIEIYITFYEYKLIYSIYFYDKIVGRIHADDKVYHFYVCNVTMATSCYLKRAATFLQRS